MHTTQFNARIVSHIKVEKECYLLTLEVPSGFNDSQPGQFVHIKINDFSQALLRRPFSIHKLRPIKSKASPKRFNMDILYEIKGKGTALLSQKNSGEYLDVIGPLGRGFDYQIQPIEPQTNIIIAGGIGVAPLVFLTEKLKQTGKNIVLIGARTKNKLLCIDEFSRCGCEVQIATEDGSRGFKGKVTALFSNKIIPNTKRVSQRASRRGSVIVYACGPKVMLVSLAKICLINKLPLQVSLEEFMGCGIGACLGCAIKTKSGYKRVCSEGPVFNAEDIVWEF